MGLPAKTRIHRSAEFRHVLRSGQRNRTTAGDRLLLVSATPDGSPGDRVGLSVSKRVGGAVIRNRVKRRLREIFRDLVVSGGGEGDAEGAGWDIVATARPSAADATYDDLGRSAARLISKIKSRR